ncbi:hypothetical protein ACHAXA_010323 [Cyclostephanos tholiformis]|uniref:Uncharacterized protein n=1 Tax=Cyclostephanos tholiformis TaxID=382380 RepID=A0ABD3RFC9_9STRA
MNASPYSQFDSKGRCVRHPTVQMCRKKLGGGWKTLTSICAMCAMESLRISDGDGPRRPLASSYHHDDALVNIRNRHHDDRSVDRSVNDQSILSAPAAYHRSSAASQPHESHQHRRHREGTFSSRCQAARQDEGKRHHQEPIVQQRPQSDHLPREQVPFTKQPSSGPLLRRSFDSESSCDLTADMYASDVNSYGSHAASSISSSSGSGPKDRNKNRVPSSACPRAVSRELVEPTEDSHVCGMEYEHGTHYTGQINVRTGLPHGLGTLRRGGCVILEGEWHQGTLIAPVKPRGGAYCSGSSYDDYVDDDDDDERYCLPTTDDEHDNEDDDASSISSTPTEGTPRNAAYSARESKPSIIQPSTCHTSSISDSIAINGTRATLDRLQEYERYVDRCHEEGDWYHPNIPASQAATGVCYDRVRRVRFHGDP